MDSYFVMCRVSGGVTGTRCAPLKDGEGRIRYFTSADDAQVEADGLNKRMNGNPHRTCQFQYWAVRA